MIERDPAPRKRRRRRRSRRKQWTQAFLGFATIAATLAAVVAIVLAVSSGSPTPTATPSAVAIATLPALPGSSAATLSTLPPIPGNSPSGAVGSPSAGGVPTDTPQPTDPPSKGTVATRIVISRLGIDLPVVRGDGVDAPLGKAAHYPGTDWPGGGSNIYLYAHARDGMFISLWNAQIGDQIDLTLVGGATKTYIVSQILPKVAWNAVQYLDPTPTEQLTLQTCTSYENTAPRFLVIAVPQS